MSARSVVLLVAMSGGALLGACIDAEHNAEIAALGDEKPGVNPGPTHRPGQPCLVCHGGSGPGSPQFSVAGTIYQIKGQSDPSTTVTVHLTDAKGSTHDATTNQAGNFYVGLSEWVPSYPLTVEVDLDTYKNAMLTHIGKDGSCATCHFGTPGPTTPGPVYLATDPSELPGAM